MNKKTGIRAAFWLAVLWAVLWSLANFDRLQGICLRILDILFPVLAGLALAFILNIPLGWFESLWVRWLGTARPRLRRGVCLFLVLLCMFGGIALLCLTLIPRLIDSIGELIENIPDYLALLRDRYEKLSLRLSQSDLPLSLPSWSWDPRRVGELIGSYLQKNGRDLLSLSMGWLVSGISTAADLLIAFVLSLYVLAQKERLGRGCRRLCGAALSDHRTKSILDTAALCQRIFSRFITGQVMEACIIGVLCFLGMLIFRMPYALLISVLVGVTALIPIFGALIGTALGAFLILLTDPVRAFWFVLMIIGLQQLEGNLIYPKVVGRSVGLPGIWVLLAVTVGSAFGVIGILLAVPLTSVAYALLRQWVANKEADKSN